MTTTRRRLYRDLNVLIPDNEADSRGDVDAPSPPSSGFGCALARSRGKRLDVARRWSRAPAVPVRPFASVRRGAAPRYRSRRCRRLTRARARGGNGELRRHGPVLGEERHDRDARRVLRHAHASRLDQRGQERGGGRRWPRRHDRRERRRRGPAALRPSRRALDRAGAGVSGSLDPAAAAWRCAGRACARPDPGAGFTVGARTRPGSAAGPNGRRGRAVGHAVARAGRFVRPNAGPSNRFAACNRGGGVGRGTYRAGSGTRGLARGGRRAGARGHGGDAHCAAARCSAGRCSAGGCGARPDERDERDTPSRAVAAPRPAGSQLEHDRVTRALPRFRDWRTAVGRSPARSTSELVPDRRERPRQPGRSAPYAASSAALVRTGSRYPSGCGRGTPERRNSRLEPRGLPPCAPTRPRSDGPGGEPAKGRTYHCSRCAST